MTLPPVDGIKLLMECYELRKRSSKIVYKKIRSLTPALWRITCDRITIICNSSYFTVYSRLRERMFDLGLCFLFLKKLIEEKNRIYKI